MRKRLLFPIVAVTLCLSLALSAGAAPAFTLVQISSDPYTNPSSQHETQVEPDSFSFGSTVVSAFQSGRFYDGGASNVGWSTSWDGGVTWTEGFLPGTTVYASPPGAYDRVSDPAVAYDAKHGVWMISTLAITGATGVAVLTSRSTDGGLTWGNPVVVSSKPGGFYDKNWITCDNWPTSRFYGNCYTAWDDAYLGNKFYVSTSSDGGLTWGAKKSPSGSGGLGGLPVVRPNGLVIVPAWGLSNQIIIFGSINGGNSWSRTRVVSNINLHTVAGGLRAGYALPSVEADNRGTLYMVWNDCRFRSGCSSNDVVLTTSTNGIRWSPVTRIPIDPTNSGVDHFIPGIAATGNGKLAVTYYFYPNANCSFSTCQLHVGFISSNDGGVTWSAAQTLAGPMSLSWIANTSQGRMVGDYISTSFAGNFAVPAFSLASAPVGGVFKQATWTATGLPVAAEQSYPLRVADDPLLFSGGERPVPAGPVITP